MRKLFMFNMVSADGFFAGIDGNIDWHVVDKEFDLYAVEINKNVDTILFGRVTYELFVDYWPKALKDPATSPEDRKIAQLIQDARKIVFSKSLNNVIWENTEVQKEIDPRFIKKLKEEDGGDIVIWGSGKVVSKLTQEGLIDEYKLMVNPVILGEGKSLFKGLNNKLGLKLIDSKTFSSGNLLLTYLPA